MANAINYAATPRRGGGIISVANTARDGSGTGVVTLITGVAAGTRIESVRVVAAGATTAGVVRLFTHDGTTSYLLEEIMIEAATPSTTVPVQRREIIFGDIRPLTLPNASWTLRASTHNAETFHVHVAAADH
jgi:hypothetical protein